MKYLVLLSRYIGGIVFIFSGFVKGVDPVGSQIKFSDYITAAGISMPDNLLLAGAMILCAFEFMAGVLLISGNLYRLGVWLYLIFMIFFTPLTLVLAIFNPVSDCGCFGDAIHLTNWETFYKNIVLLAMGIILAISIKGQKRDSYLFTEMISSLVIMVLFLLFMVYSIKYLPVIDFRPYRAGTNIPEARSVPENAQHDIYDVTFIYEKDGVQKEFTLENYPAEDTAWSFVDQKSVLVKKGYEPPVRDFYISAIEGNDITDLLLYDQGYTLLMISHNLDMAKKKSLEKGFLTGFNLTEENISFYVVTSSSRTVIENYRNGLRFCVADATLLKTIIRANPGYLLIKDGTILAKWSDASLPGLEWFKTDMAGNLIRKGSKLRSAIITTSFFLILIFAAIISRIISRKLVDK